MKPDKTFELGVTVKVDSIEMLGAYLDKVKSLIFEEYDPVLDVSFGGHPKLGDGECDFLLKKNESEEVKEETVKEKKLKFWNAEEAWEQIKNGKVVENSVGGHTYKIGKLGVPDDSTLCYVVVETDIRSETPRVSRVYLEDEWMLRDGKFCEYKGKLLTVTEAEDALIADKLVQDAEYGKVYFCTWVHNPFNGDKTSIVFVVNNVGDPEQVCLMDDFTTKFENHQFRLREPECEED